LPARGPVSVPCTVTLIGISVTTFPPLLCASRLNPAERAADRDPPPETCSGNRPLGAVEKFTAIPPLEVSACTIVRASLTSICARVFGLHLSLGQRDEDGAAGGGEASWRRPLRHGDAPPEFRASTLPLALWILMLPLPRLGRHAAAGFSDLDVAPNS